jgi:hypothetical protein
MIKISYIGLRSTGFLCRQRTFWILYLTERYFHHLSFHIIFTIPNHGVTGFGTKIITTTIALVRKV